MYLYTYYIYVYIYIYIYIYMKNNPHAVYQDSHTHALLPPACFARVEGIRPHACISYDTACVCKASHAASGIPPACGVSGLAYACFASTRMLCSCGGHPHACFACVCSSQKQKGKQKDSVRRASERMLRMRLLIRKTKKENKKIAVSKACVWKP